MTIKTIKKIHRRRQQIMVHSYLYYMLNESIVSDSTYDKWCQELYDLQQNFPKESAKASLTKEFEGFDGSSGFSLPFKTVRWNGLATWLLREHRRRGTD